MPWVGLGLPWPPPHLSLGQEVGHESSLHGVLQLAVFEDDQGGFSSEFKGHLLHPLGRHSHHLEEETPFGFMSFIFNTLESNWGRQMIA